jgi:hypothetical protein
MKNLPKTIMWLSIAILAMLMTWSAIRTEADAIDSVPAEVRIKKKIIETGHFDPDEIEVFEIPRHGDAPLKLQYDGASRPKKLRRIYEVNESGERFFPDLDGRGTAPVLSYRFRISQDNRVLEDRTFEQRVGDPIPDFRSDARVEIWVTHRGYPGRVFQVVEHQRRWGFFSGF